MQLVKCCESDTHPWITECGVLYATATEANRHETWCTECLLGDDDPSKLTRLDINRDRSK